MRRMIAGWAALAGAALMVACQGSTRAETRREPPSAPAAQSAPAAPTAERRTVLFMGTSLTAGLGLDLSQAYPALVQQKIDSAGLPFHVVNAGVSGETSAAAFGRVDWLLQQAVAVLVLEVGANDGLRGLSVPALSVNIQRLIDRARQQSPPPTIVLAAMEAPPNFGAIYAKQFRAVYPELAKRNRIPLIPFLLNGVAGYDTLNQADGIHPTAAGHRLIANTVWKTLEPILRDVAQPSS